MQSIVSSIQALPPCDVESLMLRHCIQVSSQNEREAPRFIQWAAHSETANLRLMHQKNRNKQKLRCVLFTHFFQNPGERNFEWIQLQQLRCHKWSVSSCICASLYDPSPGKTYYCLIQPMIIPSVTLVTSRARILRACIDEWQRC